MKSDNLEDWVTCDCCGNKVTQTFNTAYHKSNDHKKHVSFCGNCYAIVEHIWGCKCSICGFPISGYEEDCDICKHREVVDKTKQKTKG